MPKFQVGDTVQMPGIPIQLEVLEIAPQCIGADGDEDCREEVFRFKDPVDGMDDWMHMNDFEKA